MFGKVRCQSKASSQGLRNRKRKPKRAINGKSNALVKKKSSRIKKRIIPAETKQKKRSLGFKRTASLEHSNPLFKSNSKKKDNNYIYTTFISGSEKKSKSKPVGGRKGKRSSLLKNVSRRSSTKLHEIRSETNSLTKRLSINSDITSQRNSSLGIRRSSERFSRVSIHLTDMPVENIDKIESKRKSVGKNPVINEISFDFSLEIVQEDNEFQNILKFKEQFSKKSQPIISKLEEIEVAYQKLPPTLEIEPLKVNDETDPDCYLDAYKDMLENGFVESETKKKKKVSKKKSNVAICSGCESLRLEKDLVQNEENKEVGTDLWYCEYCYKELFGNVSYKRALVFKRIRTEKGTQKTKAKLFYANQKQNSHTQHSIDIRKSSQSTEQSL